MICAKAHASRLPMTTDAFTPDQAGNVDWPVHELPFQCSAIALSTLVPWLANTQALDGELAAVTASPTDVLKPAGGAIPCHCEPVQCSVRRSVPPAHGSPQLVPTAQALVAEVAAVLWIFVGAG